MPRIVCISDTHHKDIPLKDIPDGDILIHAGDGMGGTDTRAWELSKWMNALPHKHKIYSAGNHDWYAKKYFESARIIMGDTKLLIDEGIEIEGIEIYCSPWTVMFCNWAFMLYEDGLRKEFNEIPSGLDILVTHGPPRNILDQNISGGSCGSQALLEKVMEVRPKYHVFGHIHEGYGTLIDQGINFVNASLLNDAYRYVNKPQVIDL